MFNFKKINWLLKITPS